MKYLLKQIYALQEVKYMCVVVYLETALLQDNSYFLVQISTAIPKYTSRYNHFAPSKSLYIT